MLPLLDGALQTLVTKTDLRLFSDEQTNQVINPVYPLWLNYVNAEQADDKLFRALRYNPIHHLHRLLPPKLSKPYYTHCPCTQLRSPLQHYDSR